MTDQLCEILESFGYPLYLHGTLEAGEAYPDSFFTYMNFSTPEAAFYDNAPNGAVWGYYVYFYSTDRLTAETVSEQARQALRDAGFTPNGRPIDARSDRETHTGRMFTVRGYESYKEE